MLLFYEFIHVFVFTTNHHINTLTFNMKTVTDRNEE